VFRSNSHLYAQVIDDLVGKTVASASTLDKELKKKVRSTTIDAAKKVGELIASGPSQAGSRLWCLIEAAIFIMAKSRVLPRVPAKPG